ncbi:glycosyltransferase [Priestia megaterium]|uniref:glycosyltransferase n=1 Tax=Priestia megaterium TaxID=1404 RepID=UPI0032E49BB0
MHILIIPSFLFNNKDKTLGSFFMDQARALKSLGHKVSIIYCDTYSVKYYSDFINYEEEEVLNVEGIEIYRTRKFCPFKHGNGVYGQKDSFANTILKLYDKYFSKNKPDIIHAHCALWGGYAAYKLSKKINVPYIITEHSTLYMLHPKVLNNKMNILLNKVFSNAKNVVCVSQGLKALIQKYCERIDVIGNVIDCSMFSERKTPSNRSIFKFLTVCYMKNEGQLLKKGIDTLIAAMGEIVKEYPNCQLALGGSGDAVELVKKWADEYGVSENITYLGPLSREEVASQMSNCDCFVLPSRYETFGVVYIEAMACGKPVIATRTGGPDAFVNELNGLMIEKEDVEELTHAMKHMVNNHYQYNPKAISDYVYENFSMESIGNKLIGLYKS